MSFSDRIARIREAVFNFIDSSIIAMVLLALPAVIIVCVRDIFSLWISIFSLAKDCFSEKRIFPFIEGVLLLAIGIIPPLGVVNTIVDDIGPKKDIPTDQMAVVSHYEEDIVDEYCYDYEEEYKYLDSLSHDELHVLFEENGIASYGLYDYTDVEQFGFDFSDIDYMDVERHLEYIDDSTAISGIGYCDLYGVLILEFKTNEYVYVYYDVPKSLYDDMWDAASKGGFFHEYIKEVYEYDRVK